MGQLILSCGHIAARGFYGYQITIKGYDFEGARAAKTLSVCHECLEQAALSEEILKSNQEIDECLGK